MPTIDNLDIQIEGSVKRANDAIDSIIKNLDRLSNALKIDTSKLSNIGKSIDLSGISKQTKTISESMGNMGAKMEQSMKPVQENAKNLEAILSKINDKYKDLGKGFQFFGNAQSIQKKIDSLSNSLGNAKLKKQELEATGKIEGQTYENAVKDVIKYTNQIESLKKLLESVNGVKASSEITIHGIEDSQKLIIEYKKELLDFKNGIKNIGDAYKGIENIPIGMLDTPIENLKTSISELKAEYPQATNVISDFEAELQRLQGVSERLTKEPLIPKIDVSEIKNKTSELSEELRIFGEKLNQIEVPEIRENNLEKLQSALQRTEQRLDELRTKLVNGLTMGSISTSVDDKGFVRLQEQIAYTEKQAEALKGKISEIGSASKATSGGSNLLSNALSKLSSKSDLTSKSINGLTKSLGKSLSGMKSFTRSILSAVGIMGGLYGVIRGIGKAIDISSQLTEVQNVVDVTFGDMSYKVENFAKTSIEQFGMSELALKQYSSRFQAMGTAMGFPIDQMSDMSLELTKLTADMASFYNVEQETVAQALASGIMTGQTRPLRQYGLDLTQATLQEWAMKNGLDANIQSMTQAEKTMLRYQYVLANTGAAQGDFARTANTWANQIRILKQNFEQLASVIGKTFINALKPLVKALNVAMSYVISFAKTVSNSLGKIFGWTFEEGGGVAQDFEDAAGYADDLADSTGDVAKNIKKMQAGLRAFDELKVINMPEDTDGAGKSGAGAGLGGTGAGALGGNWIQGDSILKEYESEIDTLRKLGEYIGKTLIDAMESIDWDKVYEKARNFGKGLADFLNGLFAGQNGITLFGEIGKTIASALNTVVYAALSFGETFDFKQFGYNIADGINNFFKTFDFAALAKTINVWVKGILDTIKTAISETDWKAVWDGIKDFFSNLDLETTVVFSIIAAPALIKGMTKVLSVIGKLVTFGRNVVGVFELMSNAGMTFGEALSTIFGPVATALAGISATIGGIVLAVKNFFDMWKDGFSWLKEALMVLGVALAAIGAVILGVPALIAAIVAAVVGAVATIVIVVKDNWETISSFFVNLWNDIASVWNEAASWFNENVVQPIVKFFVGFHTRIQQIFEGHWIIVQAIWAVASKWFNDYIVTPLVNVFSPIAEKISSFFTKAWTITKTAWNVASNWFKNTVIEPVKNAFQAVCNVIGGLFANLWSGIKKGVLSAMNVVIAGIENAINWIVEGINYALAGFNKIVSSAAKITGSSWSGVTLVPNISLGRISGYESGGFPEQYSLFLAGEKGRAEMLGTVGGKTAVAGGAEITGIKDAVYSTSASEIQLLREQNELLRALLKKDFGISKNDIGKAARDYSQEYLRTKGEPAYAF